MQFLSPFLLYGLPLAGIPLIIHLLNRRRFRIIDWAPMRHLRLTLRTNRRRLRLEQWLLLIVRTALILALILAIARPMVSSAGWGAWLAQRQRAARLLVLDDSLSMGFRNEGRSSWDEALDVAAKLIARAGPEDRVTLLVTSDLEHPIVNDAQLSDPAKLIDGIRAMKLSHTAADWAAALKTIDGRLANMTNPLRQVTIITDLRRNGWSPSVRDAVSKWDTQTVSLVIVDVGSRRTGNVALLELEPIDSVAVRGRPMRLLAKLRNDEDHAVGPLAATLTHSGQLRTVLLPRLAPGSVGETQLRIGFDSPGQRIVSLALPDDALPEDNTRRLSVNVRSHLDVMLVDGEPQNRPFESETDFLALAFTVGDDAWRVRRLLDTEWAEKPLSTADLIVLANVATVSAQRAAALEQTVRDGGSLMIFPGDRLDVEHYNSWFHRDGEGVLPGRLERVSETPFTGMLLEPADRSPLAALRRLKPAALARITAKRFMVVKPSREAHPDVRVLARWNDGENSPAVLEKRVGRGRVLLWTVTADRAWSDWPIDPTYLLAIREAAFAIVGREAEIAPVTAGQPLVVELQNDRRAVAARVNVPDSDVVAPLAVDRADPPGSRLRFERTARAGVYSVSWTDLAGRANARLLAVNPDASESDLEPIGRQQLEQWLAAVSPTFLRGTELEAAFAMPGKELWRSLIVALVGLVIGEAILAAWVGRQR